MTTTKVNDRDFLRSRWDESVAEAINKRLQKSSSADSPYGEYQGRIDVRGLPIMLQMKSENVALAGSKPIPLSSVPPIRVMDFAFAQLRGFGQFCDVEMEDCIFDGAAIGANWARTFRRCSFVQASMKRAQLQGVFEDCDFSRADLSMSRSSRLSRFIRCKFSGTNLRSAQWVNVIFERCIFETAKFGNGSLGGSRFIGSRPTETQLATTIMNGCKFEEI